MERFVVWIVAGGLATVAGLWVVTLSTLGSVPWLGGLTATLAGVAALSYGIAAPLTVDARSRGYGQGPKK